MITEAMIFYENLPEEDEDQLLDEGMPPAAIIIARAQFNFSNVDTWESDMELEHVLGA